MLHQLGVNLNLRTHLEPVCAIFTDKTRRSLNVRNTCVRGMEGSYTPQCHISAPLLLRRASLEGLDQAPYSPVNEVPAICVDRITDNNTGRP
jgi:hypothetical protein